MNVMACCQLGQGPSMLPVVRWHTCNCYYYY